MRSFVRLWKLHGSVNWAWDSEGATEIVRLGQPVPVEAAAAIYPSDAKYDESRRMPFLVLQDRLRRALAQPETLTLIAGYSFGDAHLNEMIFEAAQRRPRSETIVFCYSSIPEVVGKRAVQTPNLQAVTASERFSAGLAHHGSHLPTVWGSTASGATGSHWATSARLAAHLAHDWPQLQTRPQRVAASNRMSEQSPTYIGTVRHILGSTITIELDPNLAGVAPIYQGRLQQIGQIGSLVRIPQGLVDLLASVSFIGVSESVGTAGTHAVRRERRSVATGATDW